MNGLVIGLSLAALLLPSPGLAQSCPPQPSEARCTAVAPRAGQSFSGPVLQVMNGAALCVALGPTPDQWLQVRLVDAETGVGRAQMMAATFARNVDCVTVRREAVGVAASCEIDGVSLTKAAATEPSPPDDPARLDRGQELGL